MFVARRLVEVIVAAGMIVGLLLASDRGDDKEPAPSGNGALRDGFEEPQPVWLREYSDASLNLIAHERSQRAAHGGHLSERFYFEAGAGSRFFVSYATPHIPVSDDLNVVVHVRSSRAGIQIFLRVVLPADVDPETKTPTFILVPGPIFDQVDRWQRLEMSHIRPAIEQQARVKRTEVRRAVSLEGAYVELVLVNLMGGPGETEVFLDDLEISPVSRDLLAARTKAKDSVNGKTDAPLADGSGAGGDHRANYPPLRLERNLLEKLAPGPRFVPWFPTAIEAPGADVAKLRGAGNDILVEDVKADPERLQEAVKRGFMLMPRVSSVATEAGSQHLLDEIAAFPQRPAVACWYLGDRLGHSRETAAREVDLARTRGALGALRKLDGTDSHLGLASVVGDLRLFARAPVGLDMIAIKPRLWSSSETLLENHAYLLQRRESAVGSNLGALFWAWIPAVAPPGVARNIWGDDTPPDSAWAVPPIQPAQLRLMTYLALSAGYRGLVFQGDAGLTRKAGEALRIEMSFLNLEIDLFESILAENVDPIRTYDVFDPNPPVIPPNSSKQRRPKSIPELAPRPGMLAAAVPLRERKGALLLVGDYADTAQFQPPQMAAEQSQAHSGLASRGPGLRDQPRRSESLVANPRGWRPGILDPGIRHDEHAPLYDRPGALSAGAGEFDSVRPRAVPMAIRQAELLLEEVKEVHRRLEADGHQIRSDEELKNRRKAGIETRPPDAKDLLAKAEEYIKSARRLGARRLRLGLGRGSTRRPAAKGPDVRPLDAGQRRPDAGGGDDQSQAARASARRQEAPARSTASGAAGCVSSMHLVLHPAGTLYLGQLDQRTARLRIWPQPGAIREFRRSGGDHGGGLGQRRSSDRGPHDQDRHRACRPDGTERALDVWLRSRARSGESRDQADGRPRALRRARHDSTASARFPDRRDPLTRDPRGSQQPDPDLGPGETSVQITTRRGGRHRPRLDRRRAVPVPHERRGPAILAGCPLSQGAGERYVHRHARAGGLW